MKFVFPVAISMPRPYRGLARVISLREYRRGLYHGWFRRLPVPFGWMMLRVPLRDEVIVGPWWVLGWPWLKYHYYWRLCDWALKHGWAEEPYEGCYLNELRWLPKLRRRSRAT